MATYIVSADSNPTIRDEDGPDVLIVTDTGQLFGSYTFGPKDAWTVTVNGIVQGSLILNLGNNEESTIMIGRTGLVQDATIGVDLRSTATLKNSGLISGVDAGIRLIEGDRHVITNAGTITSSDFSITDASGAGVADQVTNLGTLDGKVSLSGGEDALVNRGRIFGQVSLGDNKDTFTNFRVVKGNVDLGSGEDTLVNSGTVFGSVTLGDGGDSFKMIGRGIVTGSIDLGAGADTFTGGAGAETLTGGDGNDTVNLGGGNDTFYAVETSGGNDTVTGGSGTDTYNASSSSLGVTINLDKIKHEITPPNIAWGDAPSAEIGIDKIFGFENAIGGSGSDLIYGSAAANSLDGGDGYDELFGFGGNDSLTGGSGGDRLTGGLGRDTLVGGDGVDVFIFTAVAESGKTLATCDVIMDFKSGGEGDKIDLTQIDINPKVAEIQHFLPFIGTDVSFDKHAGALWAESIHNTSGVVTDTVVKGDVNGDGKADFSILLKDFTRQLLDTDFYV